MPASTLVDYALANEGQFQKMARLLKNRQAYGRSPKDKFIERRITTKWPEAGNQPFSAGVFVLWQRRSVFGWLPSCEFSVGADVDGGVNVIAKTEKAAHFLHLFISDNVQYPCRENLTLMSAPGLLQTRNRRCQQWAAVILNMSEKVLIVGMRMLAK